MEKEDSRNFAIASREIEQLKLVTTGRPTTEGFTKAEASRTGASDGCGESLEDEYALL